MPATAKLAYHLASLFGLLGLLGLVMSGSGSAAELKIEKSVSLKKRQSTEQKQSVDNIARQILQQPKWRILAAKPTLREDKTLYRFKLLNKQRGRISVVVIDPSAPNLNILN